MNKKRIIFAFMMIMVALGTVLAQAPLTGENPQRVITDTRYNAINSVDNGRDYLTVGIRHPMIMTFVGDDGSVSVASADSSTRDVHIYEYTKDLAFIRTIRLQNVFSLFGAFAKDGDGNYYFFFAQDVEEREFDKNNMVLAKYNSNGTLINSLYLKAQINDEKWARGFSGAKNLFHAGACRMEISGDMIAVYFARRMFVAPDGLNHQASYGFIANKNNLERLSSANNTMRMPSAGHSFNQFILPIQNGFVFADQGDVTPRGFGFAKVQAGQATKTAESFRFKQGGTYQQTFAQLGGLAQTSDGFLFAGTYEKNTNVSSDHNDSRNVFVLTMDNELNNISAPIWITNYRDKNNENAASPKIAALDNGRYLLMWELLGGTGYQSTFTVIIDKTGKLLTTVKEIPGIRLNFNDVLRYNRTNGNVYWTVDNDDKNIEVFSFNPDKAVYVAARTGAPTGGHGLALEGFTIDKTAVSQYELFTVRATIRNRRLDTFSGGQIGAALVNNNGDIVQVIGNANFGSFNPGHLYSNLTVNCTVPNTIAPGIYRLRIVIRPTGGEWRIATVSVDNSPTSINFTVR